MMTQEKIGKFIAKMRKEKDLTQEQFAEILGLKRNSLMKRLRGEVEFKVLEKEKIKELLGIEI